MTSRKDYLDRYNKDSEKKSKFREYCERVLKSFEDMNKRKKSLEEKIKEKDNSGYLKPAKINPDYSENEKSKLGKLYDAKNKGYPKINPDADKYGKEFLVLKNQLYLCFRGAYKGNLPIKRLYEKGAIIERKIGDLIPNFWEVDNFEDIKDSLEFIENLHDSHAIEHHSKNKEEIYYHMKRLS